MKQFFIILAVLFCVAGGGAFYLLKTTEEKATLTEFLIPRSQPPRLSRIEISSPDSQVVITDSNALKYLARMIVATNSPSGNFGYTYEVAFFLENGQQIKTWLYVNDESVVIADAEPFIGDPLYHQKRFEKPIHPKLQEALAFLRRRQPGRLVLE